jgi:hypothetical protein
MHLISYSTFLQKTLGYFHDSSILIRYYSFSYAKRDQINL